VIGQRRHLVLQHVARMKSGEDVQIPAQTFEHAAVRLLEIFQPSVRPMLRLFPCVYVEMAMCFRMAHAFLKMNAVA
jgi:hypothetical protein